VLLVDDGPSQDGRTRNPLHVHSDEHLESGRQVHVARTTRYRSLFAPSPFITSRRFAHQ
jgi:hypothetical protein